MSLERIGPYTIQGVLGRGGMGTVYRGVHFETGDTDAIKVLAPNFADNEHFRGRFESEIKALLKLNHKNIVKLLSYGQEDGCLFFSMELVNGNSLFDMHRKGHRFDWRQVIKISQDCANGLRHAHDRGVIHRDLKPGNLLMAVDDDGKPDHVKLTDFGIAKRFGNSQNTGTNILGTMDFMSPEQAKGEPVTFRSDLYSLGTVMFTLLSGRPPFTANSVEESLRNLTRVPAPRITTVNPDVPRELDDLISKLMEKRPEDRIPTSLALIHRLTELEEYLREYSEAQTAQVADESSFSVATPLTIEDTMASSNRTNAEDPSEAPKTKKNEDLGATALFTDDPDISAETPVEEEAPQTNVDYFNTVTDQIRGRDIIPEPEETTSATSIIWLLIGLIAVVGLGSWGVYQAFKPPSAEQLFSTIQAKADQPNRVLDEMDQFLELYPNEPRAGDVSKMQTVGMAIQNFKTTTNRLTVKRSSPNGLTDVEKQFMSIVDITDTQPDVALAKMSAFATFHQPRIEQLNELEARCVKAAAQFKVKREHELQTAVITNLRQIREKFKYAGELEDKQEAIKAYESIITLYADVKWRLIREGAQGQRLIRESRNNILRLKQAIKDEKKAARLAEEEAKKAKEEADATDAEGKEEAND